MIKLLMFLVVIGTCGAGVIPKDFSAKEHVSHSESELSDGKERDSDNCINKARCGRLHSVPSRRLQQDEGSDSGTKEIMNQLTEEFRKSLHGIDVGDLKKIDPFLSPRILRKFLQIQISSKTESPNRNINEHETAENNFSGTFSENLESSKETKLTDIGENHLGQNSEKFQTSLRTGDGELDTSGVSAESFVEYADTSQKQISLETDKENIHDLDTAENFNGTLSANLESSNEAKLKDINENHFDQHSEKFQTSLRTGNGELDTNGISAESFVKYADTNQKQIPSETDRGNMHEFDTIETSLRTGNGELDTNGISAESFVKYTDTSQKQIPLETDRENMHEFDTIDTAVNFSVTLSANLESSNKTKLTDINENHFGQNSEEFQTSLRTGDGESDINGVSAESFVKYADTSQKQKSLETDKQNMTELEIAENSLSETLDGSFGTFVEDKPTDIKENPMKNSTEGFQSSLQTGDGEFNKNEVFTESFIEYVRSNETKESSETEFQKENKKELEIVQNNFRETTSTNFNISENSLSETLDTNSDSSDINSTDAEELSVYERIASAINATDVFEFLNLTDSLNFEIATENSSSRFLDVDETALMSEGSEIALFQDDSTTGFEFLIDSETTKNMILTELLRSENFVVTENGKIALFEDYFPEIELNELDAEDEHELETIVTINSGDEVIPAEETLNLTEVLDVLTETEMETLKSVMDISVIGTEYNATVRMEEPSNSTANSNNLTKFEAERRKVTGGENISDDVIVTTPELSSKICPASGICLFWFFAQDSCSDSSECHGFSICCKIGCSKTCVVV